MRHAAWLMRMLRRPLLSGLFPALQETLRGFFPIESVQTLVSIARQAEKVSMWGAVTAVVASKLATCTRMHTHLSESIWAIPCSVSQGCMLTHPLVKECTCSTYQPCVLAWPGP